MKTYPFWYKLIYTWVNKRNRTGLTLPFLIGAVHDESGSTATIDDIGDLLDNIANTPMEELITLKRCPDLHEPVFGLEDRNTKFSMGIFISENLWIASSMKTSAQDITDLREYFEDKYLSNFKSRSFSKSLLVWHDFDDDDKALIAEARALEIDG